MEKCLACESVNCLKIINQILMINRCERCHAIFLEKEYKQQKIKSVQNVSMIKETYLKQIQKPIEEKIVKFYIEYLKKIQK